MFSNAKRSVFGFTHSGAAPQWRHAATALALAVTYFIAGKLGLSYASVHSSASAVWPPTGIALAAFLVLGKRAWSSRLPYGPYIAVAAAIWVFWGKEISDLWDWWFSARFGGPGPWH